METDRLFGHSTATAQPFDLSSVISPNEDRYSCLERPPVTNKSAGGGVGEYAAVAVSVSPTDLDVVRGMTGLARGEGNTSTT